MLSKSLIQFSVDGWSCVLSLHFTRGQTMVEVMLRYFGAYFSLLDRNKIYMYVQVAKHPFCEFGDPTYEGNVLI